MAGLCDLSPDYSPILGLTEVDGFLANTLVSELAARAVSH